MTEMQALGEKLDAVTDRLDQISKKLSRLAAAWRGQKPTDIWEVTIPGRAMQEEGKR